MRLSGLYYEAKPKSRKLGAAMLFPSISELFSPQKGTTESEPRWTLRRTKSLASVAEVFLYK